MPSDTRVSMSVLLIDDEPAILRTIGDHLSARGHRVFPAERGAEGLEILKREAIDLVITDLKMPGMDGFEVLREVKRLSPGAEVIMVTAHGDIDSAVRAMREGAFDFFTKPPRMRELTASLERTARFHALRREKDRYRERLDRLGAEARQRYGLSAIIGESQPIRAVKTLIEQVCRTEATTVLITGETGTGKELVARAIHCESARAGGPFVAVNCTAIPESLVESEFYGHVKGAFTDAREDRAGHFERADGGVLFLDEIGDMNPGMQTRLLRTLEERRVRRVGGSAEIPVDVRVVSATNRDLRQAVSEGRFREDLYYRLNTFTLRVPPLRERPEDILPLAEHFLERYAREMRKPIEGFTPDAASLLTSHAFPGNVRELRNTVERAVILCRAGQVTPDDLMFEPTPAPDGENRVPQPGPSGPAPEGPIPDAIRLKHVENLNLNALLNAVEKEAIREALRRCNGNQSQAARRLGVSRYTLLRRMAQYQMRDDNT
jgi:DNA-binding NtrC family response regulator